MLILSLMVACFSLDMVYIQIVMEEDQKEGAPGSLQPFLSFFILFWASDCIARLEGSSWGWVGLGGHWEGWRCISKAKAQLKGGTQAKLEQGAGRKQEQPLAQGEMGLVLQLS